MSEIQDTDKNKSGKTSRRKESIAFLFALVILAETLGLLIMNDSNSRLQYKAELWSRRFDDAIHYLNFHKDNELYWRGKFEDQNTSIQNISVVFEDLELGLGELRVTSYAQLENGTRLDSAIMIIPLTFEGGASYRLENEGLIARSLGCPSPELSMNSLQRMFSNNLVILSAANITHQLLTMENFEYDISLPNTPPYGLLTQSSAGYLHLNISYNEVLVELRDFNQIFWVAELQITRGEHVYYKGSIKDGVLLVEIELKNVELVDGTFIEYLKTSYQTGGE